ncbi:hypothetical protein GCM10023161_45060 [Mycobacterium paraffinicum]|uniref:Uncharacterized protein n=1 Tax=Mycobacterium paraffinicum TaxID=53378 RepID=A0ABP8F4S8_9MYCO
MKRQVAGIVGAGAKPQHGVPVQQRLNNDHHVGLGDPGGCLDHHRLVELVDRPGHGVKPAHDRDGRHRPHTRIDGNGFDAGHRGHARQPGHGLFDEDVARPTRQPGRPRLGHHLHRQDAVPAQVEERLVNPHPLQPEHLGVDAGQDLLDRVGRRAVMIDVPVLRCRQGASVEFVVDRQRQCVDANHRGGNHIGREPLSQLGTRLGGARRPGDVADQAFVSGTVLAGDHHRLLHTGQPRQGGLDLAEFDAIPADLHLIVGASEVAQLPVGTPPHEVAGAIHARPGFAEGAGDES